MLKIVLDPRAATTLVLREFLSNLPEFFSDGCFCLGFVLGLFL